MSSIAACASKAPSPVISGTPVSSHPVIADAADVATQTPWPEISSRDWGARLIGIASSADAEFTRSDAVEYYVEKLSRAESPCDDLMRDAIMQIAAAETLYREAAAISERSASTIRDIEVMETAISALRESRSIYLGAIRKLQNANDVDVRATSDFVREEFDLVAERLAELADEMADNALADETRSFAGPERSRLNGAL